ncbi:transposase family protein [Streptomyces sp. NBC_00986]|nr:transposase family protein [Streptomyces sp. NBC_00986]
MPDPRDRRGRVYPLSTLLCTAGAAVLAGARSLTAVGEWSSCPSCRTGSLRLRPSRSCSSPLAWFTGWLRQRARKGPVPVGPSSPCRSG